MGRTVGPDRDCRETDSCLLNRDSVAAGTHDVHLIMEQGSYRVECQLDSQISTATLNVTA